MVCRSALWFLVDVSDLMWAVGVFLQPQVLSLVVMCSVGKLAPVGVLSEKQVRREIQTFLGAETLHRFIIPNPWIGPPATTLLGRKHSVSHFMQLPITHFMQVPMYCTQRCGEVDDKVRISYVCIKGSVN